MTIEEAIIHAERTYKENRSGWQYALKRGENKYAERCKKGMDEFGQLAEWLKELVERRKQPDIIRCKDCKFYKEYGYVNGRPKFLPKCGFSQIYTDGEDFCSKAERRTDGI